MTESHPIFDTFIFDLDGTILDTIARPHPRHQTRPLPHFGYPTHTDAPSTASWATARNA
mgnify:CR=1 FL=1